MTVILWVLAFLGVAIIYGGDKLMRFIVKSEYTAKTGFLVKLIGVLLSAAALIVLYVTGSFN